MTAGVHPRLPLTRLLRLAAWAGACAAVAATGCRSTGGRSGGDSGGVARGGDPLLGNRIPPQNLPIPGRDAVGGRDARDPLLGLPTGGKRTERAGEAGDGNETAARPPKAPYRPDQRSTNAALARPLPTDDSELSIGDRRPLATATSNPRGPVPFRPVGGTGTGAGIDGGRADGLSLADVTAELKRYGATVDEPVKDGNQFVIGVKVPLDPADPTRLRWYEEVGPTPAAAAKKVLDQVRGDRGGK